MNAWNVAMCVKWGWGGQLGWCGCIQYHSADTGTIGYQQIFNLIAKANIQSISGGIDKKDVNKFKNMKKKASMEDLSLLEVGAQPV